MSTVSRIGRAGNDPRPLRDPQFQYEAKLKIINYLGANRFPNDISIKSLESPTNKIIEDIFKFIYGRIDPYFVYGRKIEDDIETILRVIEYPYLDGISKSKLRVLSSSNSWNVVLGFLVWMVELNEIADRMESSRAPDNLFSNPGSKFEERVFYQYLVKAYPIWLNGDEEPGYIEDELSNQFLEQTKNAQEQNQLYEAQLKELQDELDKLLTEKPPLSIENEKKALFESDKEKLLAYCNKIERKQPKLRAAIEKLSADVESESKELDSIMNEIGIVTKVVNEQQISVVEVDKMSSERDRLIKVLDEIEQRANQKQEEIWEKESKIQQTVYEIDDLELKYNENVKALNKLPPENAETQKDIFENLTIKINTSASNPGQICEPNIKSEIEPKLYKVRELLIGESHKMQSQIFAIKQESSQLEDLINETSETLAELNKQAKRHQEMCSELRSSILEESLAPSMEIDNLEKEIFLIEKATAKIENQAKHEHTASKTRFGSITRTYNEHSSSLSKELVDSLDNVLKMQAHVKSRFAQSLKLFNQ
ncbi:hypothetical protein BB560_001426 [Smittium megazygosporum]|nr:hypothetical protein BB560_001426 [Smittium megazygosporum]